MRNSRKVSVILLVTLVVGMSSGFSSCGTPKPATSVPETPLQKAARVSDEESHTLHQLSNLIGDLNKQGVLSKEKTHQADLVLLKAARDTKTFNANARLFTDFNASNKKALFDLGKQIADTIAQIAGISDDPNYKSLYGLAVSTINIILALTQ